MFGASLVQPHLGHEDVTSGQTSAEEDLPSKYGQDSRETCQPVLATEMEAEGEKDHGRGHLVGVVEVAGHVEDGHH